MINVCALIQNNCMLLDSVFVKFDSQFQLGREGMVPLFMEFC